MPITHPTDSNGITYNAIGTAAWYGDEGAALRAQGWQYCGYGTWGVYIRPPGTTQDDCYKKAAVTQPQQPNIAPTVPPDSTTTTPVDGVRDSCSVCHKPATPAPPVQTGGTPTAPTLVKIETKKPFPWWLIIVLVLVAVSHGRDD